MKVHLLDRLVSDFISRQLASKEVTWLFPHSIVQTFHQNWATHAEASLKDRYELSLKSEISQRWWKRDNYRPKEIMLKLIEADAELAALAFKDLANESSSLEGRLSRFDFYCNDLLQMYRDNHPREIETYHHQDASMISLYLAGWYPDKYVLYPGLHAFQSFCKNAGSPEVPVVDDLVRYGKIACIVYKFLLKNDKYDLLKARREADHQHIYFHPYQMVFEIVASSDAKAVWT